MATSLSISEKVVIVQFVMAMPRRLAKYCIGKGLDEGKWKKNWS